MNIVKAGLGAAALLFAGEKSRLREEMPANSAAGLVLSFLDWFSGSPAPKRKGTQLRKKREGARRAHITALHAETPNFPETRQVRRASIRALNKRAASAAKKEARRASRLMRSGLKKASSAALRAVAP